jgi:hypothetical protein
MGNELSIFRMLQMITSDKKGRMQNLLNTTGNIELDHFNKAAEIVKALTEILDTYGMEEFLNVFRGVPTESHGVKIGKLGDLGIDKRTQSWKNALSKYFVRLMASELDASSSYKNPSKEGMANLSKRTELLKNLLKENKWEGVYYHMKLKKGEEVKLRQFKLMDYDKTNITFRNKPITIDRKIDTNAYVADVLPVIDEILNAVLDEDGNYLGNHLNKDTIEYLNNKKS